MSEADKIIESLKNSGRKVEEFYTGNKTSDKNVANIEKDIKNIKQYINLVLDKNYCDCNELNVISTGKHCDGSKNVAYSMQNILAELEQKDKRIQELEEERDHWHGCFIVVMENSIAKEKVKDKIEELDIAILECEYDDDDVEEYKNDVEKEKRILLIKKSALEELLEEK